MRKHPIPNPGDTVSLNDNGLKTCFGNLDRMLSHMKSKRMKITSVDTENLTEPEETYTVTVDDPEINQFLLSHWDFDVVEPGHAEIEMITIDHNPTQDMLNQMGVAVDTGQGFRPFRTDELVHLLPTHLKVVKGSGYGKRSPNRRG